MKLVNKVPIRLYKYKQKTLRNLKDVFNGVGFWAGISPSTSMDIGANIIILQGNYTSTLTKLDFRRESDKRLVHIKKIKRGKMYTKNCNTS